ncbi:hypothetical protein L9F63_010822, partial [Diploptera punctata]
RRSKTRFSMIDNSFSSSNRFSMVGTVIAAQKLVDRHSLKILKMEPSNLPSNNSHQQLMTGDDDDDTTVPSLTDSTGIRRGRFGTNVSMGEWLTIIVLCFVNLINYMDRFTVAGKNYDAF